jgi:NitT/TauT family transport system substrate-binding protein
MSLTKKTSNAVRSMFRLIVCLCISLLFLTSCKPAQRKTVISEDGKERIHITLQTDWYAQPEHGGYYQALVNGYYADEGLAVKIIPGGLRCANMEKAGMCEVDFSIGRSDDVIVRIGRGVPITIIGIEMQRDPTAIFFHPQQNLKSLKDLNGRTIKAGVGMIWTYMLKHKLNIDFTIIPTGNGHGEFIQDETLLQQGFVTNEPFFIKKAGGTVDALLIHEAIPDTYRVIITSKKFAEEHPEIVEKFVRATLKGWKSFLLEDPSQTYEAIIAHNPQMQEPGFLDYSRKAILQYNFVEDNVKPDSQLGKISLERIQNEINALKEIDALDTNLKIEDVVHVPIFEKLQLITSRPTNPTAN